jgi:ribosome-binding protein aMBF1 (putative translation factor)
MEHQDWKPVVLTNKTNAKKENTLRISKKNPHKDIKIENEIENFEHKKVSLKFKTELQKARLATKITQKELATRLNISPKIINDYENGKIIPNIQLIIRMDKILNTKLPRK